MIYYDGNILVRFLPEQGVDYQIEEHSPSSYEKHRPGNWGVLSNIKALKHCTVGRNNVRVLSLHSTKYIYELNKIIGLILISKSSSFPCNDAIITATLTNTF